MAAPEVRSLPRFWRGFLRSLFERRPSGVQLVVSDAHAGLKKAIGQVLGCPWQRCTVHYADVRVMPTRAWEVCAGAGIVGVRSA